MLSHLQLFLLSFFFVRKVFRHTKVSSNRHRYCSLPWRKVILQRNSAIYCSWISSKRLHSVNQICVHWIIYRNSWQSFPKISRVIFATDFAPMKPTMWCPFNDTKSIDSLLKRVLFKYFLVYCKYLFNHTETKDRPRNTQMKLTLSPTSQFEWFGSWGTASIGVSIKI